MILHAYFARRFLAAFLAVLAIFFGILVLIGLVDQVRRFEGEAPFATILGLTVLRAPGELYEILPLVTILATLALFLALARSSELVVVRASGRSALASLLAPLAVAAAIGAVAVAVLNPIAAATSKQYEIRAERIDSGGGSAASLSLEGLWLRQGDAAVPGGAVTGQTVIRAERANLDGTELYGVSFLGFRRAGGPAYRIEADRARLGDGEWIVEGAKEWRFDAPNPERGAVLHDTLRLPSALTADQILDGFATPSSVPVWDLPAFVERLEAAGFSAQRHRLWLQMQLALPLLLMAMVLVGAGFTMRRTRSGGTGLMVLLALGLGFALFFVRNFAQILGENGQIPIALAAWGPPAAAVLLPLGLLLHWEDG